MKKLNKLFLKEKKWIFDINFKKTEEIQFFYKIKLFILALNESFYKKSKNRFAIYFFFYRICKLFLLTVRGIWYGKRW